MEFGSSVYLLDCVCSIIQMILSFNPLMSGGNESNTYLKDLQLKAAGLSMYGILLPPGIKGLRIAKWTLRFSPCFVFISDLL